MAEGEPCIKVNAGVSLKINEGVVKATESHGGKGIVLEDDSTLHMVNVHLTNFKRGAIRSDDTSNVNVKVEGCKVTENHAGSGPINIKNSAGSNLTIIDSVFANNTNSNHGGAVYFEDSGCLIIKNSEFIFNTAGRHGGAISMKGEKLSISSSLFISNKGAHGILFVKDITSEGVIESTKFVDNKATADGGGIYLHYGTSKVTVESDVILQGNVAGNQGNGIYCKPGSGASVLVTKTDDIKNC